MWMRLIWFLAMSVVTALALLPPAHLQLSVFDWWDKAQHALAFAVLTVGALWLWPSAVWRVVPGMLAYGAGIELAQWLVGWRSAEWADWAADAVGVALAWLWMRVCRPATRPTARSEREPARSVAEPDQDTRAVADASE